MYSGSILQDTIEFTLSSAWLPQISSTTEAESALRVELINQVKAEQIKLGNAMGAEYRIHRLHFHSNNEIMTANVVFARVVVKHSSANSDNLVIPFREVRE